MCYDCMRLSISTSKNYVLFRCRFSKLEHMAHSEAKNENTVKTNFCLAIARTHTHTHTHSHFNSDLKDVSVFDDPILKGRL